jgi:branched-chain amino acid transport system substrate-binding protein
MHIHQFEIKKRRTSMRTRKLLLSKCRVSMVLFVALTFLPAAGFCAEKQAPKTLTIGCIAGLSGFSAGGERGIAQGSQLAVDYVNNDGGITINNEKYLINLVTEDHKSTTEGAAAAATKLVYSDKVKLIAGGTMPFTNIAINSVTEPAKVLNAAVWNLASPAEYGPKTPYKFVTMNGAIEGVETMLAFLAEAHPEIKTIAVLHPDDGSVRFIQPHLIRVANKHGIKLSGKIIPFANDTVDFTTVTKKALARNPDAIGITAGWPTMTAAVLKIARQAGYTKPIWCSTYQSAEECLNIAGKEVSNLFYQHGLLADDPQNDPMVKEIQSMARAKYGEQPIYYTALGFDNAWMLLQAIEAAQSTDPTKVRDKWETLDNMKSVWGGIAHVGGRKTYGIRHTVTHPIPIIGLMNGEIKTMKWIDFTAP